MWFEIVLIALYLVGSHLVAYYIGQKRESGYGNTLFVSILFSPLVGIIYALARPKLGEGE